jgi:hypothetical protein
MLIADVNIRQEEECNLSSLTEKNYGREKGIGQHIAPNRGPAGGNTGQRTVVRVPGSITPLDVDEANRRSDGEKR